MTGFLALELRRSLRDVRYLVIAVALPIGLYLLFAGLFGSHGQRAQGLPQPVELMVAMVAYGATWAVFSATGPRIAHERAIGWTRQLRVTPLSAAAAVSGKLVTALAAALPAMALVALTAVLSHHVQLTAGQWLAMLAVIWAGVLPLALLGLAIGYLAADDIAFPLTMALYFALGALGGLWIPPSAMPHAMQDLGQALPSNSLAELGWRIAGGQASALRAALVLAAWLLGTATAALFASSPTQHPVSPLKLTRSRTCRALKKGRTAMYSRNSPGADPPAGRPRGGGVPGMDALIRLDEVIKRYDSDAAPAVHSVSMEIAPGESVAVMGPSGSGKSTLLNMIAGLDRPTSGTVAVAGERIDRMSETGVARFRRQHVGMIFQFFNLLDDMTVLDNILLPAQLAGLPTAKARVRADELLQALRIGQHRDAYPARLSGGQRQRVAIARALVNRPALLLADEPTGALDTATGQEIGELLAGLNSSGQTLILVTHNPDLAAQYAGRVIEIVDGRVASDAAAGARR